MADFHSFKNLEDPFLSIGLQCKYTASSQQTLGVSKKKEEKKKMLHENISLIP